MTDRHSEKSLRLLLPDTIVYGGKRPALWIYMDSAGFAVDNPAGIRRLVRKADHRKMGTHGTRGASEAKYPVALNKETSFDTVTSGGRSRWVCKEGKVTVLSNESLQEFASNLGKLETRDTSAVLQRFVKCRGSRASIVRTHWRAPPPSPVTIEGRQPTLNAWKITSTTTFGDSNGDRLRRFTVVLDEDDPDCAAIYRLRGLAVKETGAIAEQIADRLGARRGGRYGRTSTRRRRRA